MKLTIPFTVLVLILGASAAGAQAIDPAKLNMVPLIQLHAEGADLTGGHFAGDVFIYQGGYTLLAYTSDRGNVSQVFRGIATPPQIKALNQALRASRVGRQTGNCGDAAPDYVSRYALTWYGKQRLRTIPAGGNYTDCPAEVVGIFDATCRFIWDVLGSAPQVCVPPL
jgi:hypothetical protein